MKNMMLSLLVLLAETNGFGIPIPNEYIQCRSVRPVVHTGTAKSQYVNLKLYQLGGAIGLVRYKGPIYSMGNIPGGMQKTIREQAGFSEELGVDALTYTFRNNLAAQLFHLEVQSPQSAQFPEES